MGAWLGPLHLARVSHAVPLPVFTIQANDGAYNVTIEWRLDVDTTSLMPTLRVPTLRCWSLRHRASRPMGVGNPDSCVQGWIMTTGCTLDVGTCLLFRHRSFGFHDATLEPVLAAGIILPFRALRAPRGGSGLVRRGQRRFRS